MIGGTSPDKGRILSAASGSGKAASNILTCSFYSQPFCLASQSPSSPARRNCNQFLPKILFYWSSDHIAAVTQKVICTQLETHKQ